MPWFESSKDKQFRELIEGKMQICLKKPNQYAQAVMILNSQVTKSNQKAIEIIVDHIKQVIKEDDYQPAQKVRAMMLLRDLMETHNKALGKYVVTKILKRLTIFAQHRKNQNDENRGANIFKCKKSQEKHGIQFLKILLLCLADWGKNWPKNPDGPFQDFQNAYNDLLIEKQVRFPLEQRRASKSPVPKTGFGTAKPDFTSPPKMTPSVPTDRKIIQNALSKPAIKERTPVTGPLADYLNEMIEMLNLLSTTLTQNPQFGQIWSVIKAYVQQFQSVDEKGNLIVAQMIQKGQQNVQIIQAIQANSDFIAELKKDTNTVDKKNQSYGKYNGKYIKNCKKLVLSLSIFLQKPGSSNPKNNMSQTSKPVQTSINQKVEEIRVEKPKVEAERNRYGSSYQLRNQLQINLQPIRREDFNSGTLNKGNQNSQGSSRYNSISANQLEKNRGSVSQFNESKERQGSIPTKQQGIKKNQTKMTESRVERKNEQKQAQKDIKKQISKITQKNENESSFNKFDFDKDVPNNQTQKQNEMFGEFQTSNKEQKQMNSNSNFFKQIDGRQAVPLPKGTRNRKPPNKMTNQNNNFFDNSIKSKVESSQFSGFQKSKDKSNSQSKSQLENRSKQNVQNSQSKSQLQNKSKQNVQNSRNSQPKGFDTFKSPNQIARAIQQLKKSDSYSQKSGVSNPFDKPFENDGNPFKAEDGNSFYKTQKSFDDPFASKNDKASKIDFDDPFASNLKKTNSFVDKVNENPFESKIDFKPVSKRKQQGQDNKSKSSNPFSQKNDGQNKSQSRSRSQIEHKKSEINAQNPFDARSQNSFNISKDNPFEKDQPNNAENLSSISNPFDKSQKKIEGSSKSLSQRGSFKNVQKPAKITQKVSSIIEDPFESVKNEQKKARNSQQNNKSKTQGPEISKQKEKQKSFNGFDFDDFDNINKSKSQTSSVKHHNKQEAEKKHNQSGFNFSQFGDVRNSVQQPNRNSFEGSNFFEQTRKSGENKNSKQSSFDFFQQNNYGNQKPEKDDQFETQSHRMTKEKPMLASKDFFQNSKEEESKKIPNTSFPQNRNSGQGFNFDDFQNVSKNSNTEKNSNSNPFTEFEQSKGTIDPIKKQQIKPPSNKSSDEWNKFGKAPNESSDEWQKFANIAQKQSEDSKSNKNEESKYEQSQSGSKVFAKKQQFPWLNEKKNQSSSDVVKKSVPKIVFQQQQEQKQPRFGNSEKSLSIHFDEPSPFQKKEIPWQYTPNSGPNTIRYNIRPQDIAQKKQILSELDKEHQARCNRYHELNEMLNLMKKQYAGSLENLGEIRGQNRDFKMILKRIKETNRLKQIEIQDLIKKKRKAEQIKTKMLEKERQLYQLMKSQRRPNQDHEARQRVGNKWQKFNQNLQKHRQMTRLENTISHFSYYA